jgi:hypothetical protein
MLSLGCSHSAIASNNMSGIAFCAGENAPATMAGYDLVQLATYKTIPRGEHSCLSIRHCITQVKHISRQKQLVQYCSLYFFCFEKL